MKLTEKLGLKKPDLIDYVNIGDLNDNMDVLDEEVGSLKEGTTEVVDLETLDKTYKGAINELDAKVKSHKADYANPHNTNKSDVGLSNVDNVKQMPISGGVLENYREKLNTVSASGGSINLSLGNVFQHTPSGNMTYSITNAVNGQAQSFTLIINMGSTVRTLTFPASVKWQGGEIPDLTTVSKTYILTFLSINGGTTWFGMSGGEF